MGCHESPKTDQKSLYCIFADPFINILITSMKQHGCEVTPEFFKCRPCPIKVGGFYDETLGVRIFSSFFSFVGPYQRLLYPNLSKIWKLLFSIH